MQRPIVIAHHLVWTAYGWWLPNDPRGSTSRTIASDVISQLGELHFGRRQIQPASCEIRKFYNRAKDVLKHELLEFNQSQIFAIAESFAETIKEHEYTCYACAIMPDHVHILIRKHRQSAEEMINNLQASSRLQLGKMNLVPPNHPVWCSGGWKVFIDHPDQLRSVIKYIRDNPVKQKLLNQNWSFVKEYDGWPLHPGHNPNSPYVKRLRTYRKPENND